MSSVAIISGKPLVDVKTIPKKNALTRRAKYTAAGYWVVVAGADLRLTGEHLVLGGYL